SGPFLRHATGLEGQEPRSSASATSEGSTIQRRASTSPERRCKEKVFPGHCCLAAFTSTTNWSGMGYRQQICTPACCTPPAGATNLATTKNTIYWQSGIKCTGIRKAPLGVGASKYWGTTRLFSRCLGGHRKVYKAKPSLKARGAASGLQPVGSDNRPIVIPAAFKEGCLHSVAPYGWQSRTPQ